MFFLLHVSLNYDNADDARMTRSMNFTSQRHKTSTVNSSDWRRGRW